jgi:hypothetical protein
MSADPNKKTPRQFQCRESLWQKFEQMARELECSVDYLINDAMKQYARQRGYTNTGAVSAPPSASSSVVGAPLPPPPPAAPPVSSGSGAMPLPHTGLSSAPPTTGSGAMPLPIPPPATAGSGAMPLPTRTAPPLPLPPPPAAKRAAFPAAPAPPPPPAARRAPPPPARSAPPATTARPAVPQIMHSPEPAYAPAVAPGARSLAIHYQGEMFPVTKDRFIIGRGKQTSDLTIKDPNVSRQHAMIEFLNGQYYIVDMGSTNGVEYNGQRIQRKVIGEGDIFRVCDHELRFSYLS